MHQWRAPRGHGVNHTNSKYEVDIIPLNPMPFFKHLSPRWTLIAFSLLVHLPGLTSPLLDYHAYRQTQTASMARNYVRHGMEFFRPELDTEGTPRRAGTEFPIYSYMLAVLFKLFGVHDILGRLLSVFFAAWGALLLFEFVRPRLGERTAWISGLAMSAIPVHVYFTRSVQPEPMALWGLLGFLYHMDRWLNRSGRATDWFLATFMGAIAPLLKLPFIYLLAPLWLLLGWEKYRWDLWKQAKYSASLIAMIVATLSWYHYSNTAPVGVLPLTAKEHWANLRPIFSFKLWNNHFLSRLPELCTTYTGLLFAGVGATSLYKERRGGFWGGWFAATALYIVLLGQYGITHRYTSLPFAPICAVFIAIGIVHLWDQWPKALIWVLVLGIPIHTAFRIKHWYELEYPWVFQAREKIAALTTPQELIITNTREHPVLLYHLNRYGYAPELEETGLDVLKDYRIQGARIFLTPTAESWQRNPDFATFFEKHAKLLHTDPDYLIYRLN